MRLTLAAGMLAFAAAADYSNMYTDKENWGSVAGWEDCAKPGQAPIDLKSDFKKVMLLLAETMGVHPFMVFMAISARAEAGPEEEKKGEKKEEVKEEKKGEKKEEKKEQKQEEKKEELKEDKEEEKKEEKKEAQKEEAQKEEAQKNPQEEAR